MKVFGVAVFGPGAPLRGRCADAVLICTEASARERGPRYSGGWGMGDEEGGRGRGEWQLYHRVLRVK